LYLRRSFVQSQGYSRAMLERPVVGIAYTPSVRQAIGFCIYRISVM
jgi:hypothetical protein